jgi:hypothetical protein
LGLYASKIKKLDSDHLGQSLLFKNSIRLGFGGSGHLSSGWVQPGIACLPDGVGGAKGHHF